jgi:hypothetical protein
MRTAPSLGRDWESRGRLSGSAKLQTRWKAFNATGVLVRGLVHVGRGRDAYIRHHPHSHGLTFFIGGRCSGNVGFNDGAWDEEHGSPVFSRPVTVVRLKVFVVFVAIACGSKKHFRGGRLGNFFARSVK